MSSDSATSTGYTSLSSSTSSVDSLSTPPVSTTPPPSRSGSNASDSPTDTVLATTSVDDLSQSISSLNEYQVTSATQDDSESDSFDEKVLESDTFKWQELETFTPSSADFASSSSSSSIPPSVVLVDNEVISQTPCELPQQTSEECQKPLQEQQNDSDDSMPPLISDSDESNTEDQDEDDEDNEDEDEEDEDEEEVGDNKEEDQLIMVFRAQEQPTEVERSLPSFIHVITFVFFFLHLFHYLELLTEKRERQNHPCFVFKY